MPDIRIGPAKPSQAASNWDLTTLLSEQIGKLMALCRAQLNCHLAPGTSAHRVGQQTQQTAVRLTSYTQPLFSLLGLSATTAQLQRLEPIDRIWLYSRSLAVVLTLLLLVWLLCHWVLDAVVQLLVPSYAVFSLFYWPNVWWKSDWGSPQCQIAFATVFTADLLISIFTHHWRSTITQLLLSCSAPLAAILLVPYATGSGGKCPHRTTLQLVAMLFFTRFAARKSFTQLPLGCRQFFAYSLGFCGISASTSKLKLTDKPPVAQVAPVATPLPDKPAKKEFQFGPDPSQPEPPATTTVKPMVGRGRRTSLPAGSLMPVKLGSTAQTPNTVSEARGLLADMLAWKDLPPNVVSGLRAINTLLNPHHNAVSLDLGTFVPTIAENPMTGENFLTNLRPGLNLRSSPVTWSTVTSATGLPTVEPEPNRARSSSYWKTQTQKDSHLQPPVAKRLSLDQGDIVIQTSDGILFDINSIAKDVTLARLNTWEFSIFSMTSKCSKTELSQLAYRAFVDCDLFKIFKIPLSKFFNFFHSMELGYRQIPYHNRLHAGDVLQATYYMVANPVAACSEVENTSEKLKTGSISTTLAPLELMALFTAAAMHDYDHPGRTNAFLVATRDGKAILYNDRSVLENYHAAASWQLLTQPDHNFIDQLDDAEFKRFRYLVLETILATDLKRHFEILGEFGAKTNGDGISWEDESDRLLVTIMLIKMADINSPCRPQDLHTEWTKRIVEEFYLQGDEEKRLGLPVSNYMDRNEPQVAKLQDSFICHLVSPLVESLQNAEMLLVPDGSANSELLSNLRENHKLWMPPDESPTAQTATTNANDMPCITEEADDSSGDSPV